MSPPNQPPRWTQQLAEDEEVRLAYEHARVLRRLMGRRDPSSKLPPEIADQLDWQAAERSVGRIVKAHGHWADEQP